MKTGAVAARIRRHTRVRRKVRGTADAPRLCVFRSLNYIYAQVIDDGRGHTLASASSLEDEVSKALKDDASKKMDQAALVGSIVAKRALGAGISRVVFDRGGCKYHGRVKALAEAARQAGLKF
ncbi:MAG: 50S ribosomal protein L18 [Chloroflexi bacterium]|nr:50S ribosomal protein L18 [Chloroflexota bacterium]